MARDNNDLYDLILLELIHDDQVKTYLLDENNKHKTDLQRIINMLENKTSVLSLIFGTPAGISKHLINDVGLTVDISITNPRLFQVISAAIVNRGNDDTFNPHSLFNEVMYNAGGVATGLSPLGIATLAFCLLSGVAGFAIKYYQLSHMLRLATLEYVLECALKAEGKKTEDEKADGDYIIDVDHIDDDNASAIDQVAKEIRELMLAKFEKERRYLEERGWKQNQNVSAKLQNKIDGGQLPSYPDIVQDYADTRDEAQKAQYQPSVVIENADWALNKSLFATVGNKIFDLLNDPTYLFWLVWMPIVGVMAGTVTAFISVALAPLVLALPLGLGMFGPIWELLDKLGVPKHISPVVAGFVSGAVVLALTLVPLFLPVAGPAIMIAAVVLGAAIGLGLIGQKIYNHFFTSKQEEKKTALVNDEVTKKELTKEELAVTAAKTATEITPEFERQLHEGRLRFFMRREHYAQMKKLEVNQKAVKKKRSESIAAYREGDFDIATHLTGSKIEQYSRVILKGITSVLFGVIIAAFISWFASAVLSVMGPAFAAAAAWVGSTTVAAGAGAVISSLFGIREIAKMRKDQLAFEQKARAVLDAPYMRTHDNGSEIQEKGYLTREQVFKRLYAELESKKADWKAKVGVEQVKKKFHGYDLDEIDVFNDRFFRKFEKQAGAFSLFKRVASYIKIFVGGAQSGAFLMRFSLLKSYPGILAGGVAGIGVAIFTGGAALVPFLIALAVAGLVYGVINVVSYQLQRNQERRELFINTFDERISYMKKKIKELDVLEKNEQSNGADSPNSGASFNKAETDQTIEFNLDDNGMHELRTDSTSSTATPTPSDSSSDETVSLSQSPSDAEPVQIVSLVPEKAGTKVPAYANNSQHLFAANANKADKRQVVNLPSIDSNIACP